MNHCKIKNLVQIALVASLYVVMSLVIAPFSYGPIQVRLSEMLNLLVVYDKKYIYAVTLGCALANISSPYGITDIIVGAGSTFVTLWVCYWAIRHLKSFATKLWVVAAIVTASMFTIAGELYVLAQAPFWLTYATIAVGEAVSLVIGVLILLWIHRHYDKQMKRWLN